MPEISAVLPSSHTRSGPLRAECVFSFHWTTRKCGWGRHTCPYSTPSRPLPGFDSCLCPGCSASGLFPSASPDAPAAGLCPLQGWETAGARSSEVTGFRYTPIHPVRLWLREALRDELPLSQEAKAEISVFILKNLRKWENTASQLQLLMLETRFLK